MIEELIASIIRMRSPGHLNKIEIDKHHIDQPNNQGRNKQFLCKLMMRELLPYRSKFIGIIEEQEYRNQKEQGSDVGASFQKKSL